jgi:hypothetical protein
VFRGYNGGKRRNDKMVFTLHYTGCDRNAFGLLQIDTILLWPCLQHICDEGNVTLVIVVVVAAAAVVVVVVVVVIVIVIVAVI